LLFGKDDTGCTIEVYINDATFSFLNETIYYFTFFASILIDNSATFCFADFLNDNLLGCLSCDTTVVFLCFEGENYFLPGPPWPGKKPLR
jgi:hypothetical protein